MSRIRGKGNKTTEIALAGALRKAGITGWRRHVTLKLKVKSGRKSGGVMPELVVVTPDFLFRKAKLVVFVDGCFWHQCPLHSKVPENNHEFWAQKLRRNVERDRRADRALRTEGWRVLRLWEHALRNPACAAQKVKRRLQRNESPRIQ